MKKATFLVILFCVSIFCSGNSHQGKCEERQMWDKYFRTANVQDCFLLYDLQSDEYFYYFLNGNSQTSATKSWPKLQCSFSSTNVKPAFS
jgi:hypothetical protein